MTSRPLVSGEQRYPDIKAQLVNSPRGPSMAASLGGTDVSKPLLTAAACGVVLAFFSVSGTASAADRGFCRDYTRAALRQVRAALSHPRCDWRVDNNPARWSTDGRSHFDWCLGVDRDQADAEREARRRTLDHCAVRW